MQVKKKKEKTKKLSPLSLYFSSFVKCLLFCTIFFSCIWNYFNKTSIGFISGIARDLENLFQRDRKMSFIKLKDRIVIFVSHQELDFFIIQLTWTACNLVPCSYIRNTLKQTDPSVSNSVTPIKCQLHTAQSWTLRNTHHLNPDLSDFTTKDNKMFRWSCHMHIWHPQSLHFWDFFF